MTGDPTARDTAAARDAFAGQVTDALYARDATSKRLGVRIEAVGLGWCRLAMRVADEMLNGHAIAHGGFIFTLADTAMAYASNSGNQPTLAQHAQITFVSPGQAGETLIAEARELSRTGRNGIYDVEVRGEDGRLVAAFRGAARAIKGKNDPNLGAPPALGLGSNSGDDA